MIEDGIMRDAGALLFTRERNSFMKKYIIAALMAGCFWTAGVRAGEEPVPEPMEQESQWEKFKSGAKQAGEAVAAGSRNTAHKVADGAERAGDAMVRGSKKAGRAVADGYEDTKDYLKEKLD